MPDYKISTIIFSQLSAKLIDCTQYQTCALMEIQSNNSLPLKVWSYLEPLKSIAYAQQDLVNVLSNCLNAHYNSFEQKFKGFKLLLKAFNTQSKQSIKTLDHLLLDENCQKIEKNTNNKVDSSQVDKRNLQKPYPTRLNRMIQGKSQENDQNKNEKLQISDQKMQAPSTRPVKMTKYQVKRRDIQKKINQNVLLRRPEIFDDILLQPYSTIQLLLDYNCSGRYPLFDRQTKRQ